MTDSSSSNNPALSGVDGGHGTTATTTFAPKKVVRKAIGPKLRIVFNVVLALLALIGANSAYLGGVTFLLGSAVRVANVTILITA